MGFLDFAKDVGRQLFDTDAEAADNIKQHLEVKMTGIHNVKCEFDDGVATLHGDCDSQKIREQAILIAGNVKGVAKVVADDLRAPPEPEPKPEAAPVSKDEFYEIAKGDTLGAVAKKFYGKASAYMKIYEANKDIISDPDKIYPGQKIRIPMD